jgi:hypothetical protein
MESIERIEAVSYVLREEALMGRKELREATSSQLAARERGWLCQPL